MGKGTNLHELGGMNIKTADPERVELIKLESLDKITLLNMSNWILIELHDKNTERQTKGGLWATTETTWDSSGMEGQNIDRIGKVAQLPKKLYYMDDESFGGSMPWDTKVELKIDDEVLIKPAAMYNAARFLIDKKEYRLIQYSEILCGKRKEEYIPINGYVFCELVDQEKINDYDLLKKDTDNNYGIVKHIAKPVKYQAEEVKERRRLGYDTDANSGFWSQNFRQNDDGVEIEVGDKIMVRRSDIHIRTEYEHHTRFFEEMYFVIQRKDIVATVK